LHHTITGTAFATTIRAGQKFGDTGNTTLCL